MAALRIGDKPWDPPGNNRPARLFGIRSPQQWRWLAAPGVRWRSLAPLVRLLISRFSVRFRVGALDLRDRCGTGPTTNPTTFLSFVASSTSRTRLAGRLRQRLLPPLPRPRHRRRQKQASASPRPLAELHLKGQETKLSNPS